MQYYEFDVYDCKKSSDKITDINLIGKKKVFCYDRMKRLNTWLLEHKSMYEIGSMRMNRGDIQNVNTLYIEMFWKETWHSTKYDLGKSNLIPACIYFAVQHVITADWLNDRDQFLYPNIDLTFKADAEGGCAEESLRLFQRDCLAYSLFHSSNNIQSGFGMNHWLPFTEEEVSPKELFKSHFMTDFIAGNSHGLPSANPPFADLLHRESTNNKPKPLEFSPQATDLFTCGRKLWRYYHQEARNDENYLNDASFYDIRRYFQGINDKGQMKQKSSDSEYNVLISDLRKALKTLGEERIVEKVFEYGFLLM